MSDRPKMTTLDLAHKVAWEGGILGTLEYGIRSDEIADPEIAAIWADLERHYGAMREPMTRLDRTLRQARRERP